MAAFTPYIPNGGYNGFSSNRDSGSNVSKLDDAIKADAWEEFDETTLNYTPHVANSGYNGFVSTKAASALYAKPDGTFKMTLWEGPDNKLPTTVVVAFTLPGGQNIWNDALQEFVFKRIKKGTTAFEFIWDNTKGFLPVGTITLHYAIDDDISKREIVIEDNPFYNRIGSKFFTTGATPLSPAAAFEVRIPMGIPAFHIGSGVVDNTEFSYLDGVTSAIQSQLDAKVGIAEATFTDAEAAQALANMNITFTAGGYLRGVDADGNVWHIALNSGEPPE